MQTENRTRGQSQSYGLNTQRLGRELKTISELMTLDGKMCILQLRGLPPFLSPKFDLKKHPNYKYTAEANINNSFTISCLVDRRMTPDPNENYTVYEIDRNAVDSIAGDGEILDYSDLDDPDAYI